MDINRLFLYLQCSTHQIKPKKHKSYKSPRLKAPVSSLETSTMSSVILRDCQSASSIDMRLKKTFRALLVTKIL